MTLQEVFDKCARHLLTQMAKSELYTNSSKRICAYRGDNGLKCAAGVFINDDRYSPSLEGACIQNREVYKALWSSGFPDNQESWKLLAQLQDLHDWWPTAEWKSQLIEVAKDFQLNGQVLEEFP